MDRKSVEEKIQKLRQELNVLANQLVLRSPEGQRMAGQIETWEEILTTLSEPEKVNPDPKAAARDFGWKK